MATIVEEKTLDELHKDRTPDGKFLNRPGPGRPSARIKSLRERYAECSGQEAIKRLAADVASLTAKLGELDADYQKKEDDFVESVKPLLKEREEVASLLARARVCVHYLADPAEFQYTPDVRGQLESAIARVSEELEKATTELSYTRAPDAPRSECLGSDKLWAALRAYETIRDRVEDLQKQKVALQRDLEQATIVSAGEPQAGGPSRRPRRRTRAEEMAGL